MECRGRQMRTIRSWSVFLGLIASVVIIVTYVSGTASLPELFFGPSHRDVAPSVPASPQIQAIIAKPKIPVAASPSTDYVVANTLPPDDFLALRTLPTVTHGRRILAMPNGTILRVIYRRDDGWWYVEERSSNERGWALSGQSGKLWIVCCAASEHP